MPETLKPELKPCPWKPCSGLARVGNKSGSIFPWSVVCSMCGSRGPYSQTKERAIEVWNTRPQSELEKLAREVVDAYGADMQQGVGPLVYKALDRLSAYFRETGQEKERTKE